MNLCLPFMSTSSMYIADVASPDQGNTSGPQEHVTSERLRSGPALLGRRAQDRLHRPAVYRVQHHAIPQPPRARGALHADGKVARASRRFQRQRQRQHRTWTRIWREHTLELWQHRHEHQCACDPERTWQSGGDGIYVWFAGSWRYGSSGWRRGSSGLWYDSGTHDSRFGSYWAWLRTSDDDYGRTWTWAWTWHRAWPWKSTAAFDVRRSYLPAWSWS